MTCKHIVSAVLAASLASRAETITTTGANVTMTTLPDDQRDSYWDKWPTGRKPLGRTTSSALPANQWVLRWTEPGQPTVLILR